MNLFSHCLNHDDSSPTLEPIIIVWTLYAMNNSSPKACDWTLLCMEIENCFLNHSKPTTWAHQKCIRMINIKGQKLTRCMPSKCKPKPKPFHCNQGSSPPSLKHPKWTKKKQVVQLCLTPHLVCNIMVKLKVCLFIPCFYVSLNSKNSCSIWCTLFMYFFFFLNSKKIQDFQIFPKKREKFKKKKKGLWTRGIQPLSHFFKKSLN